MTDAEWAALIEAEAVKAKSKSVDGVASTRRDLRDLAEAQDRAHNIAATSPNNISATLRGMSVQIVPPGGP